MTRVFPTLEDAAAALADGGVLLLNTDTLPGFHGRADRPETVARLAALKGRPDGKPLLVLAGSPDQAASVTQPWNTRQAEACRRCWPGPFSLILPAGADLAPAVTAGGGTVAVRVPAPGALRDLILAVGAPLVSTSVNAAGEAPCGDLASSVDRFGDRVDGLWDDGRAPASSRPSALVDLTVWPPVLVRPGPRDLPSFD